VGCSSWEASVPSTVTAPARMREPPRSTAMTEATPSSPLPSGRPPPSCRRSWPRSRPS
jgi:hypothetical protein